MKFYPRYPVMLISLLFAAIGAIGQQLPLNWTIDEVNPGEDVTLSPDDTFFTEGTRSCKMQLNSGAVPYLISGIYPVVAGTPYEFSIDVFDNDTSGQVKVFADFFDAYGFDIFGAPPQYSVDTNEWQTLHWADTIPAQAVVGYVLVKYYCQPNLYTFTQTANAWIDNTRFIQGGGSNLVANGGFEQWAVGIGEYPEDVADLVVYPNPARDLIYVELPADGQFLMLSDLCGRQVLKKNITGSKSIQLEVNKLMDGIYLLTVSSVKGQNQNIKVLVSHR
jgi:hypothetical protein